MLRLIAINWGSNSVSILSKRCVVISALLSTTFMHASNAAVLEEVTVTAQKREQNVQDVGIAITALSGDQMRSLGMTNSVDVARMTPNAEILSPFGSGQNANLVIRGVGLNDFNNGNEAPVTAYVDEFYLVSLSALDFLMYDLERSEVLKGPQGTLFGRNSNGGLFHFISAKPTKEFSGYADLSYAEFDELKFEGAVSGPLTDFARARLSFSRLDNDGTQERTIGGLPDGNQQDVWSVRAQLEVDIKESAVFSFKYEHAEVDNILPSYKHRASFADGRGLEQFVGEANLYGGCGGCDFFDFRESQISGATDDDTTASGGIAAVNTETDLIQARLEWDFEAFTLTSITGYMDLSKDYLDTDIDGGPSGSFSSLGIGNANGFGTDYETDYWTQEIRLHGETGTARWTVGFYYMNQDANETGTLDIYGDTIATALVQGRFNWTQEAESTALFGQAEYDISDQITVIGGARYSWEEKEFTSDYKTLDPFDILGLGPTNVLTSIPLGAYPFTGDLDDELFTAKLALDYRPNDDHLLYASISRGQKVGGFNNGQIAFIFAQDVPFGEETVMTYEIGSKSALFGDTSRLNISIFYSDYEDFQAFSFNNLDAVTGNNDAEIFGAEIDFYSNPIVGLEFQFGASYLDTELENVTTIGGAAVTDTEMAMAPEFTVNGLVRYEFSLSDGFMLAPQLDFQYVDERFAEAVNHPTMLLEDYVQVNARATLFSQNRDWELAVFVKNLNDTQHDVVAFPLSGFFGMSQYLKNPPRQFGAAVSYHW